MDYYNKKRTRSESNKLQPVINNVTKRVRSLSDIPLQQHWPHKPAVITSNRLTLRLGLFNQGKQSKTITREASAVESQHLDDHSNIWHNSVNVPATSTKSKDAISSIQNVAENKTQFVADGPTRKSGTASIQASPSTSTVYLTQAISYLKSGIDTNLLYPTAPDYFEMAKKRLSDLNSKRLSHSPDNRSTLFAVASQNVTKRPTDNHCPRDKFDITVSSDQSNASCTRQTGGDHTVTCDAKVSDARYNPVMQPLLPVRLPDFAFGLDTEDNSGQYKGTRMCTREDSTGQGQGAGQRTPTIDVERAETRTNTGRMSSEPSSSIFNSAFTWINPQLPDIPDDVLSDGLRLIAFNEEQMKKLSSAKKTTPRCRQVEVSEGMDHSGVSRYLEQPVGSRDQMSTVYAVGPRDQMSTVHAVGPRDQMSTVYAVGPRDQMSTVYAVGPRDQMSTVYEHQYDYRRDRDILDSIDDSQSFDEFGVDVTALHSDSAYQTTTGQGTQRRNEYIPWQAPGRLVSATDSDGSPMWNFISSVPPFFARPVVYKSPELKYYRRRM